jgi:hypothetical protein
MVGSFELLMCGWFVSTTSGGMCLAIWQTWKGLL